MIHCFITDCSPLEDTQLFSRAYALLSEERREKADFYRFPKDKMLSVVAGLYIKLIEQSYGNVTADEKGKLHAAGVEFNLSHSGHYVAFAVSDRPVGVDIEAVGRNMDIARRVMTEEEYKDYIDTVEDKDREDVFIRMWTAKESYMKALGLGFRLAPETFRVLHGYELRSPDETMRIQELSAPERYHVSVCSEDVGCSVASLGVVELIDADSIKDFLDEKGENKQRIEC